MSQRSYLLDFSLSGIPCQVLAIAPAYESLQRIPYHTHRHSSFELHAIFRGAMGIRVGGEQYEICAGQGILIAPDTYHTICYHTGDPNKMCLNFALPRPETLRGQEQVQLATAFYAQEAAVLPTGDLQESLQVLCRLANRFPNPFWDEERLKAATILLILSLYDKLGTPITVHHTARQPLPQSAFIIDEFFNLHFNLSNGNELLARQLHMSTRQLDRVLRKYYNMGYREKLQDIRLANAMDYLLTTDKSIAEIAELIGYSTPANFSAFIKRATGRSPTEIRADRETSAKP